MISEPVGRTLSILETLSRSGADTLSLGELADKTRIPKSTLLRILSTLVSRGYAIKTTDKKYIGNCHITKTLPLSAEHIDLLKKTVTDLVDTTGLTVEILTVENGQLYWYDTFTHPDQAIRIAAHRGFTRHCYELDAPSRVYLRHCGTESVRYNYKPDAFFKTETPAKTLSWQKARTLINQTPLDAVVFDEQGNKNGIRRYTILLAGPSGNFLYLLCIAEPAVPRYNDPKHRKNVIHLLTRARRTLQGAAS